MWRALLPRRALLLALALAAAAGASYFRAGSEPPGGYQRAVEGGDPAEALRANLVAHLADRHRLSVDPVDLRVVDDPRAPPGAGRPVAAWFTAAVAGHADLFSLRARVSPAGVPVALSSPHNVSRTPEGDELLLDADADRVLFAVRVGERIPAVTRLDFGDAGADERPWTARLAATLDARQAFGTDRRPRRLDAVLAAPTGIIAGRLDGDGLRLTTDAAEIAIADGVVGPPGAAEVLPDAPPDPAPLALAADALRRAEVIGARRVLAVEETLLTLADWLRGQRHRLFPTAADRLPVAPLVDVPPGSGGWPPADVPLGAAGLPGEGRWQSVEGEAEGDPAALQTFVRVDPERPFARTHLFAFDMRRLGLHFVAGAREPRSSTGVRGSGRIPAAHRPRLRAAFDGGLPAVHGRFGAIESGRVIVRPTRGLATVVTDPDGHAGFGLWDAEALPPPWTDLRQNLAPLIEAGEVEPRTVRRWGGRVAALDDVRTARSALGLTAEGVLVYGWSASATAERLGEALRRAGVVFALHLDLGAERTGLALFRPDGADLAAARGAPEMAPSPDRWLGTSARDLFYLVRADRAPAPIPLDAPAPDEGRWRPIQRLDGVAVMASTWIDGARVGARRQVPLLLLEAERLRPHAVPGLAEIRPGAGAAPAGLGLPGPPLAWLDIGLRAAQSPYGFVVAGRTWRLPQPGLMTFAATEAGDARIGRFGDEVPVDGAWRVLVQGPALLADGAPAEGSADRGTMPIAGLGRRADGRLVFGADLDGDRAALAAALRLAGAIDALLLGERGTADTGAHRLYFARGDRLWTARPPTGALEPARLAAGAGSALVFTGRRPPPSARILPTFAPSPKAPPPSRKGVVSPM